MPLTGLSIKNLAKNNKRHNKNVEYNFNCYISFGNSIKWYNFGVSSVKNYYYDFIVTVISMRK